MVSLTPRLAGVAMVFRQDAMACRRAAMVFRRDVTVCPAAATVALWSVATAATVAMVSTLAPCGGTLRDYMPATQLAVVSVVATATATATVMVATVAATEDVLAVAMARR